MEGNRTPFVVVVVVDGVVDVVAALVVDDSAKIAAASFKCLAKSSSGGKSQVNSKELVCPMKSASCSK